MHGSPVGMLGENRGPMAQTRAPIAWKTAMCGFMLCSPTPSWGSMMRSVAVGTRFTQLFVMRPMTYRSRDPVVFFSRHHMFTVHCTPIRIWNTLVQNQVQDLGVFFLSFFPSF